MAYITLQLKQKRVISAAVVTQLVEHWVDIVEGILPDAIVATVANPAYVRDIVGSGQERSPRSSSARNPKVSDVYSSVSFILTMATLLKFVSISSIELTSE